MKFTWKVLSDHRVEANYVVPAGQIRGYFGVAELEEFVLSGIKWCRDRNMRIWRDTSQTIRFSAKKDMTAFLLACT